MNNATLALNVSRPAAPASPPATGRDQDDTSSSKRFDAALDAAHANARDPHDQPHQTQHTHSSGSGNDTAPAAKTADARKTDRKQDDEREKKEDTADDDTSIATTMLSLIGVPPKVTGVAAKVLGAVNAGADTAGETPVAPAALAGVLPGGVAVPAALGSVLPGTAAGALAAAEGLAGANTATPSMLEATALTTAATTAVAAPSFASLLAGQGVGVAAAKDDPSADPANPSPMPFTHSQAIGPAGSTVVQVQATQAATSPQFAQELGEQIAWMGSGDVKEARIKLHPEELGSMDVRVSMDGGKVNLAIMAQHPAAVHAVQQTLSQLDSMLAHHGLSLGQADVGQRQAERGGDSNTSGSGTPGQGGDAEAISGMDTVATTRVSRGLVDEVA